MSKEQERLLRWIKFEDEFEQRIARAKEAAEEAREKAAREKEAIAKAKKIDIVHRDILGLEDSFSSFSSTKSATNSTILNSVDQRSAQRKDDASYISELSYDDDDALSLIPGLESLIAEQEAIGKEKAAREEGATAKANVVKQNILNPEVFFSSFSSTQSATNSTILNSVDQRSVQKSELSYDDEDALSIIAKQEAEEQMKILGLENDVMPAGDGWYIETI